MAPPPLLPGLCKLYTPRFALATPIHERRGAAIQHQCAGAHPGSARAGKVDVVAESVIGKTPQAMASSRVVYTTGGRRVVEPKPLVYGHPEYEASLLDRVFETLEAYHQLSNAEEKLARGEACQVALRNLEEYLVTARIRMQP